MKHAPISWEWALVFISSIIFMLVVEAWKYAKRVFFRRSAAQGAPADEGLAIFDQWRTMSLSNVNTLVV